MQLDGLMQGKVHHARLHPKKHNFSYDSSMVLIDVKQIDTDVEKSVINKSRLWSANRFSLVSFFRQDYIGGKKEKVLTIYDEVKQLIFKEAGKEFNGKVKLLTHPRQWGFVFNPVSFYFCYDEQGELKWIISEINNTPWNETHAYLHDASELEKKNDGSYSFVFDKCFHVSPFMPMDMKYEWDFFFKENDLKIIMKLFKNSELQFMAGLNLEWQAFTTKNMNLMPVKFPLQTFLIVYRIYWNALLLYLKRVPFYTHPDKLEEDLVLTNESKNTDRN